MKKAIRFIPDIFLFGSIASLLAGAETDNGWLIAIGVFTFIFGSYVALDVAAHNERKPCEK